MFNKLTDLHFSIAASASAAAAAAGWRRRCGGANSASAYAVPAKSLTTASTCKWYANDISDVTGACCHGYIWSTLAMSAATRCIAESALVSVRRDRGPTARGVEIRLQVTWPTGDQLGLNRFVRNLTPTFLHLILLPDYGMEGTADEWILSRWITDSCTHWH